MPKHEPMSDDELVTAIYHEVTAVRTTSYNTIAQQRIESNYAFENLQTAATTHKSRLSKVKYFFTPSVCRTLVMQQSKVFCGSKKTVEFVPRDYSEEVSVASDQLSEMVNKVLHQDNSGFDVITEMFRSAAVNKTSVAKITWGEYRDAFEEEYPQMSEEQISVIIQEKESMGYEVDVSKDNKTEIEMMSMEVDFNTGEEVEVDASYTLYDYTLRMSKMSGKIDIDVLPPEEFIINEDTTSIHHDHLTRFVGHKREMLRGDVQDLIDRLGSKVDVSDLADYDSVDEEYEKRARHDIDGTFENFGESQPTTGPSSKLTIVESWIRVDRDGDGYPEWRHCFTVGNTLIYDEEWFGPLPFTSFTFFPIAHKFYGMSVWDVVRSYDETATSLIRADVDMTRLRNTFRLLAKEGQVDRRNLQQGTTGVIPTSNTFDPRDVMVVPTPQGSSNTFPLLNELRMQVKADTGIDPIAGVISSDIEKSGNDAEKTATALENSNIKTEGYSRRFAEGPLRDICWIIAVELAKNKDSEYVQQIANSIIPGVPFLIGEMGLNRVFRKTDIVAKVGLGHMAGYQKIAAGSSIAALIGQLEANPSSAFYNIVMETMMGWGYEHPEKIIGTLEEWQQKKAQMDQQQQFAMQMQQSQIQLQAQQFELEQQKFQFQQELAVSEQQFKQQLDQAETMAKIEEIEAKTGKTAAEARKILVETQIVREHPPTEVGVVL